MKPIDCSPHDWPLYYNGTYMHHSDLGVVSVRVMDGAFEVRNEGSYIAVDASTLTPIWPVAQALNLSIYHTAIYIGRRARRAARRSCTQDHYWIIWAKGRNLVIDGGIIRILAEPPEMPLLPVALDMLDNGMNSVAISHDLIIYRQSDSLALVCRGTEVGSLVLTEGVYHYVPEIPESPLARRVQFKLDKEGILCHLI